MQAAFNKATTSEKRPLAQTDTYKTGTIFDYTRPEFPSMLKPEAREKLWNTKTVVSPKNFWDAYSVLDNRIYMKGDKSAVDPMAAEHESIHALSIGDESFLKRLSNTANPLFWKDMTPKQQSYVKDRYGVTRYKGLERVLREYKWWTHKHQEAPAVLWESVKGNPRAVSLYSAAVPFFQKYFRSEFFE